MILLAGRGRPAHMRAARAHARSLRGTCRCDRGRACSFEAAAAAAAHNCRCCDADGACQTLAWILSCRQAWRMPAPACVPVICLVASSRFPHSKFCGVAAWQLCADGPLHRGVQVPFLPGQALQLGP